MEPVPKAPKHFSFEHPEQEELYRRLLQIGPGPAAFYRDACHLMSETASLTTRTHLVAHLLREIESSLRDVLRPLSTRPLSEESDGREKHKVCVQAILQVLGIPESDMVAGKWIQLIDEGSLHEWAHRDSLNAPRPCSDTFTLFFRDVESLFLAVLRRYEVRFLNTYDYIDRIVLRQHPPRDLKARLPANQLTYRYLFSKVSNPDWLILLQKQAFFNDLPQLVNDDEGQVRVTHEWPQVIYLQNMAKNPSRAVQERVLDIMLAAETNYYYIHQEFTKGILAMPVDLASRWANSETIWIREGGELQGLLPDYLGDLCIKLAKGGMASTAIDLLREILAILPDPEAEKKRRPKDEAQRIAFAILKPQIRCERYHYEEVLKKNASVLVGIAPFECLELLADLLEKAICYALSDGEILKPRDLSYIHRSAVEDHPQNYGYELDDPLISAVRDSGEAICRQFPGRIAEVIHFLEEHGWNIFKRIALHILRVVDGAPLPLIEERLASYELFDEPAFRHEYFHLAKAYFGKLATDTQRLILTWIDEQKSYREFLETRAPEHTHDQAEKAVRRRQYERLVPIEQYLDKDWAGRYQELKKEFDEPEHPDFVSFHTTWVGGPESPKKVEELEGMAVPEITEFLSEWKPTGKWRDPTPESLGLALRAAVTEKPEKYSAEIDNFIGQSLDPTYIRNLITGFNQAIHKNIKVEFRAVFKLCQWVIEQERTIPGREMPQGLREGLEIDLDWGPSRREIADLLEKVFNEEIGLPYDFRAAVWGLIEPLTRDPEPDLEYEAKYGGKNMDPLTLSINTIRGKALHSVMNYTLWLCRDIEKREKRHPSFADTRARQWGVYTIFTLASSASMNGWQRCA